MTTKKKPNQSHKFKTLKSNSTDQKYQFAARFSQSLFAYNYYAKEIRQKVYIHLPSTQIYATHFIYTNT